jgi:hypothetical protein
VQLRAAAGAAAVAGDARARPTHAHDAMRASRGSARLVSTIGTRAPSTMPALAAPPRYSSCLASMLPLSRSGTTRMSAAPATSDSMPLSCRGRRRRRCRRRAARRARARDLPAVGHLAQRRGIQRRRHLRVDGLDRGEHRHARPLDAEGVREVDRVAHDVRLVLSVGAMLIAASVMMNGRG